MSEYVDHYMRGLQDREVWAVTERLVATAPPGCSVSLGDGKHIYHYWFIAWPRSPHTFYHVYQPKDQYNMGWKQTSGEWRVVAMYSGEVVASGKTPEEAMRMFEVHGVMAC